MADSMTCKLCAKCCYIEGKPCKHLDQEAKRCKVYFARPKECREYLCKEAKNG